MFGSYIARNLNHILQCSQDVFGSFQGPSPPVCPPLLARLAAHTLTLRLSPTRRSADPDFVQKGLGFDRNPFAACPPLSIHRLRDSGVVVCSLGYLFHPTTRQRVADASYSHPSSSSGTPGAKHPTCQERLPCLRIFLCFSFGFTL